MAITKSFSRTARSMNAGIWSPGAECQRSSVTSTPSVLSRVASCLTHSLWVSSSQEYEMKVLGTVGLGSGVAMVSLHGYSDYINHRSHPLAPFQSRCHFSRKRL